MAHVDNLRRHFPALRHVTFLNTGTFGALPDVTIEAMQKVLSRQLSEGRRDGSFVTNINETKQAIREQLGLLFHTDPNQFALTTGTTEGINIVLWGLPLMPGDEIIMMDGAHQGSLLPTFMQKQRRGVTVRVVEESQSAELLLEEIQHHMNSRTRLIVCNQVSYDSGHRLPIEQIATLAHDAGAYLLVDGAQGAGAEALDLSVSNVDFYAFPAQKWLLGPEGAGALYVRRDKLSLLQQTFVGAASMLSPTSYDFGGSFLPAAHTKRFEAKHQNHAVFAGWLESLQFGRVTVGWDYAFSRIHGLSGQLIDQLLDLSNVEIVTPRDARVGLVNFRIGGVEPEKFVAAAKERSIDVRAVVARNNVRVSTGFYNSEDELSRLVQLVKTFVEK